jgi:hypothetical protein
VDFYLSETRDRKAAKRFLKKALANPDNRPPRVFARDGLRSYPAAIRELQAEGLMHHTCRHRTRPYANNRIESDHRSVKRRLRAMQGPRSAATARRSIQGIAVEAFRKDLPWFARLLSLTFATLACWSFLGGGVLRTIAPRTLIVQISALLGVMIVAQGLDLMSYVIPAHGAAHQDSAYGVVAAWLVQVVFVSIPLVWGAFQRLPRIVILGVILTVAEFILQFALRPRLRYYLPEFVIRLVVYWPFAYIAIRTGNYWTRVYQHRS